MRADGRKEIAKAWEGRRRMECGFKGEPEELAYSSSNFFMVAPNYLLGHFITFFPLGPIFFFTHTYVCICPKISIEKNGRGKEEKGGKKGKKANQQTNRLN
jgi:hypothetical protein